MVQKVRIQIMLETNALTRLEGYRQEFLCKNYNDTVHLLLKKLARMDFIMEQLEQKAKEGEGWKKKAENPGGLSLKARDGTKEIGTGAIDAKKSINLKQKSVENMKDTRKPKGGD